MGRCLYPFPWLLCEEPVWSRNHDHLMGLSSVSLGKTEQDDPFEGFYRYPENLFHEVLGLLA